MADGGTPCRLAIQPSSRDTAGTDLSLRRKIFAAHRGRFGAECGKAGLSDKASGNDRLRLSACVCASYSGRRAGAFSICQIRLAVYPASFSSCRMSSALKPSCLHLCTCDNGRCSGLPFTACSFRRQFGIKTTEPKATETHMNLKPKDIPRRGELCSSGQHSITSRTLGNCLSVF